MVTPQGERQTDERNRTNRVVGGNDRETVLGPKTRKLYVAVHREKHGGTIIVKTTTGDDNKIHVAVRRRVVVKVGWGEKWSRKSFRRIIDGIGTIFEHI